VKTVYEMTIGLLVVLWLFKRVLRHDIFNIRRDVVAAKAGCRKRREKGDCSQKWFFLQYSIGG
jgi:hypothetical protein